MLFKLCTVLFAAGLAAACVDDASASSTATREEMGSGSGSDHGCPPPLPPKEAVDACASSNAGDACAFDIDSHHVTGTCRRGPDSQGPLACAPDQPPPPPPQK